MSTYTTREGGNAGMGGGEDLAGRIERLERKLAEAEQERADLRARLETFELNARIQAGRITSSDGLRIEQFQAEGMTWTCAVRQDQPFDPRVAREAARLAVEKISQDSAIAKVRPLRPGA